MNEQFQTGKSNVNRLSVELLTCPVVPAVFARALLHARRQILYERFDPADIGKDLAYRFNDLIGPYIDQNEFRQYGENAKEWLASMTAVFTAAVKLKAFVVLRNKSEDFKLPQMDEHFNPLCMKTERSCGAGIGRSVQLALSAALVPHQGADEKKRGAVLYSKVVLGPRGPRVSL